jgi:dolichol-phosphate mannosyltransferase
MAVDLGKTLIFIPTYNERDNVIPMLTELVRHAPNADFAFMDDNSPDGTGKSLDEAAKKEPRLHVIHRAGKLGVGGAHLDGIAYGYDRGYDTLVTLDCDFTHSPSDIPRLLAASVDAHVALGSRHLEPHSLPGWHLMRKALTKLAHVLTVRMLGLRCDATGAFRVYRLSRIPREVFDLVQERGYAFFFESLFILHVNELIIREVPIKLPAREYGQSKLSLREVRRSIAQLLRLSIASNANPAQFRLSKGVAAADGGLVTDGRPRPVRLEGRPPA